jgi:hypothetical protein
MASPSSPTDTRYRYRATVIDELGLHGIRPTDRTPPTVVRAFLNDVYTYELRRLRAQLLRQEFPKASYAGRVIAIRRRYPLLSIPLEHWLEPQAPDAEFQRGRWSGSPCS